MSFRPAFRIFELTFSTKASGICVPIGNYFYFSDLSIIDFFLMISIYLSPWWNDSKMLDFLTISFYFSEYLFSSFIGFSYSDLKLELLEKEGYMWDTTFSSFDPKISDYSSTTSGLIFIWLIGWKLLTLMGNSSIILEGIVTLEPILSACSSYFITTVLIFFPINSLKLI